VIIVLGVVTESQSGVYECICIDGRRGEIFVTGPIRLDHGELVISNPQKLIVFLLECAT
jgi:hypothetical protein